MRFAGHETTGGGLAMTLYELARHPDWLEAVQREIAEVVVGPSTTAADVPNLKLLDRVHDETMRLNPPVWLFDRIALEDDEVDGYKVPANTVVGLCTWALHRQPKYWPDPDVFDPTRFEPEKVQERGRFAFLPFATGPRVCIGRVREDGKR